MINSERLMAEEQIFGNLDKATLKEKFSLNVNELEVIGWSFSSIGNDIMIEIFIDGKKVGETKTGLTRPDVFEAYHTYKAALTSGFVSKINIEKINEGKHVLKVTSRANNIEKQLRSENFNLGS